MSIQKKNRKYGSVADMIRDVLPEDKELTHELSEQMKKRHFVRRLANLRNSKDISQDDVAQQIGCGQSRVSKLENGFDADLSIGDLQGYAKALECELGIVLRSRKMTIVDEVKLHAGCIKHCFDRLNELAEKDEIVAKGVAEFHVEALLNLVNIVKNSSTNLSEIRRNGDSLRVSLQLEESCDDDEPLDEHQLPLCRTNEGRDRGTVSS